MKTIRFALATLCLCAAAGCSNKDARVTFTHDPHPATPNQGEAVTSIKSAPRSGGSVYAQFPGAYITSNRDGEYDIVLVNDTLRVSGGGGTTWTGKKVPLQPVAQPPLQQAIHLHVFWRPVAGAMVRESSVTNAIINWYVFNSEASAGSDMVHYQGAAFVTLKPSGDSATITIGDGQISPHAVRGAMKDPVGPSRITGTIYATRNDARVRELIAGLADKAAGRDKFWTEAAESDASPAFRQ